AASSAVTEQVPVGAPSGHVTKAAGYIPSSSDEGPAPLARPRLIRRLREAVRQPVTVITAPAGYGKTVLVDQWAAEHVGPRVVRATLRSDDDWARTAGRITAEMASTTESIVVIDAVDALSDEGSARDLAAVVDRAPPTMHLVVISRSRSVPVLSRLHGRTDVSFLTAADLAFTAAEARMLVRLVAELDLGERELERLLARTEGWAEEPLEFALAQVRSE